MSFVPDAASRSHHDRDSDDVVEPDRREPDELRRAKGAEREQRDRVARAARHAAARLGSAPQRRVQGDNRTA